MRGSVVFHSCLVLSVALFVGCSKHPTDEQIQSDIQTKVAADPEIKDSSVAVVAKEGKVTLTGKVKSPTAEKKLQEIAKEEPGVSDVVDQTSVDSSLPADGCASTGARSGECSTRACCPLPTTTSASAANCCTSRNSIDGPPGAAIEFQDQPGWGHVLGDHGPPDYDRRKHGDPARFEGFRNRS